LRLNLKGGKKMVECKNLDPTALGLFLVAIVSFALALNKMVTVDDPAFAPISNEFFMLMGILALFVAYFAYRAESQFGFTVFALVGAAVALTGFGMGTWENIFFGVVFLLAIVWSIFAKTPKNLTLILVTTALIFLIVGLSQGLVEIDAMILGIVALFNGIFAIILAFALATEKLPVV
jgi:hypothetical protein